MKDNILQEYDQDIELLKRLKPRLKTLIEVLINENQVEVHDVQVRVKGKPSLKGKIQKNKVNIIN